MKKITLLFLVISAIRLSAQPGQPDSSFGVLGTALGPFTTPFNANRYIIQLANGKLLATGYQVLNGNENMYIVRYNSDGSFDSNFGSNGIISDSSLLANNVAFAIAEQSDGKIVVTGAFENPTTRDIFVKRYDSTGVVDTSFGLGGTTITDFQNNSDEVALDIKIQPDGKIVLCGSTASGFQSDIMLLRFNIDGTPDTTFGNNGKVSTDIGTTSQTAHAMALQPDGRIVVAGMTDDFSTLFDILLLRYNANGDPDSSFNSVGFYRDDIGQDDDELFSVALQPDGKIVAAGMTNDLSSYENDLVIRLDSTGHLDSTFNTTGMVIKDYNGGDNRVVKVMLLPNGKIVTAGSQFNTNLDISLTRYTQDGTDDLSFGVNGHTTHTIGIEDEHVHCALLQSDNKVVVTGSYTDGGLENIFTSRYANDTLQTLITTVYSGEIKLYPQPAISELYIDGFSEKAIYSISDLNGRLLADHIELSSSIDIGRLEPGIYFICLSLRNREVVKRFIKL
jgi:uncharacterized delta-60 repeat protein